MSGGDLLISSSTAGGLDSGIELDRNATSSSSPTMSDENIGTLKSAAALSGNSGDMALMDTHKMSEGTANEESINGKKSSRMLPTSHSAKDSSASAAKKNLMPHSLLSIPPKSTPIESQPLVELENADSGDEEFALPLPVVHHGSMGRKDQYRRVHTKEPWSPKDSSSSQLKHGSSRSSSNSGNALLGGMGYDPSGGFSLTDSGDELDLIPPTQTSSRCSCISMCPSLFSSSSYSNNGYSYYKTPGP